MSTVADGLVTLDDIRKHLAEEERDAGLSYAEIIDARTATPMLSTGDVRSVVAVLRDLGTDHVLGPTAIVVSTDYAFGLMRMLGMLIDDVCAVRPFRTIPEAEAWLQAPADGP